MIRCIGSIFVIGCGWIGGHIAFQRQKEQLRQRMLLLSYLDNMKAELEFDHSPFEHIAENLAPKTVYKDFSFAHYCVQNHLDLPFYLRFREAVQQNKQYFGTEICEYLEGLSIRLGNYSSENQAAAIEICLHRITQLNGELREKVAQNAKLYHSLGLLAGTAIVIFLW